jgi:hypothetical protein
MATSDRFQSFLPHLAAAGIFLLVAIVYFFPQIQGKEVPASDIIQYKAMSKEIRDFRAETGERSLWTNSIFGGMPTYQIDSAQPSNLLHYVEKTSNLFIARPIGYFFAMALMFYLFMIYLKVNPWVSVIGALAFSFSAGNMTLFEAGHMTKLRVLASFGIIAMGLVMAFRKDYLKGGILYALGIGLSLYANHIQMTYYFFLGLGILVLIEIIKAIKEGQTAHMGKFLLVLLVGTTIGVGSSASKLWTTYEYAKDTMRGDPILESKATTASSSSETKGLEWDYAMQWSNGWADLMSSIIPRATGGGSAERVGTSSALYKDLRRKGANIGADFKAPLYFGSLPFTSGPYYFGAIFCFLFILGLMNVKGSLKWWIAAVTLLMLLASLGKNFSAFNKLLFDFFPMFNKFRTPNSILVVAGFFVPILGMLALSNVLKEKSAREQLIKQVFIAAGITGGLCLLYGFLAPSMMDMASSGDARLAEAGYSVEALKKDRASLLRTDALRSFALIAAAAALIWAYLKGKIQATVLIAGVGVLAVGDVLSVAKRYVDSGDFEKKSKYEQSFVERPVDKQILADPDPYYRVFDLSINTFNSASSSYFHKTIGGYNAAKLQRYQDLIDYQISKNNQAVLAMLNTKYVIRDEKTAQPFPGLGNAWTVRLIKMVNTPNEEIEALTGLDPKETAIVHKEYRDYVDGLSMSGTGSVKLTDYKPNHLTYSSDASGEELAVFSEIWYGPDKGWQAYIDGQAVEHIRVNYILRALKIPEGKHKIEFKFEPSSYYKGELITLILSILLVIGLLFVLYTIFKDDGIDMEQGTRGDTNEVPPSDPITQEKKTIKASKRKKK